MKGIYKSHAATTRGRATGIDLVINVNGEDKTKFIASFGDSKKAYDILRTSPFTPGQGIELKMTKVSRNGQDFWNPCDIMALETAPPTAAQTAFNSPIPSGAAPTNDTSLRIECMKMAVSMMMENKKATPDQVLDMAATFYNDIKAEVFGVSANFVPDLDAIATGDMTTTDGE